MIDLLLGVYNYLIKPRLQDLEGHHVSSQEWKKDGIQTLTESMGTKRGKGLFGYVISWGSQGPFSGPCHPQSGWGGGELPTILLVC